MVLEALIAVREAERRPIEMLPLAFLYSSIAILLAMWIFTGNSSLPMVFFTVMALLPLMVNIVYFEAQKEQAAEHIDLDLHKQTIPFFVYMFLGLVISYAVWAILLPHATTSSLFNLQIAAIKQINAATVFTGNYFMEIFIKILSNNLRVLIFSLFFSFLYGAGAIFILTWNASVISIAIGNVVRTSVENAAAVVGSASIAYYFHGFSLALLRYMIHGIPEITGYFIGGLAGGIISVAVLKHKFGSKNFNKAMIDVLGLTMLAIFVLFVAALLEIGVSPLVPI